MNYLYINIMDPTESDADHNKVCKIAKALVPGMISITRAVGYTSV